MTAIAAFGRAIALAAVWLGLALPMRAGTPPPSLRIDAGLNQVLDTPAAATQVAARVNATIVYANSTRRGERPQVAWSVEGLASTAIRTPASNPAVITFPARPTSKTWKVNLRVTYAGLVRNDSLFVTINPAPTPRLKVNAGPDVSVERTAPGDTRVVLGGTVEARDFGPGITVAYAWSQSAGPAVAGMVGVTEPKPTVFLPPAEGRYTFRLVGSVIRGGVVVSSSTDYVDVVLWRAPASSHINLQVVRLPAGSAYDYGLNASNDTGFDIVVGVKMEFPFCGTSIIEGVRVPAYSSVSLNMWASTCMSPRIFGLTAEFLRP